MGNNVMVTINPAIEPIVKSMQHILDCKLAEITSLSAKVDCLMEEKELLVEQDKAQGMANDLEAAYTEIEKMREALGLTHDIDYARFLDGLGLPTNRVGPTPLAKPLVSVQELLEHLREALTP